MNIGWRRMANCQSLVGILCGTRRGTCFRLQNGAFGEAKESRSNLNELFDWLSLKSMSD